jgi:hypothetical protein
MRYIQISDFLPLLEIDELDEFLFTVRENHDINLICQELKDFESISKALRKDTTMRADTRLIFDKVSLRKREMQMQILLWISVLNRQLSESSKEKLTH